MNRELFFSIIVMFTCQFLMSCTIASPRRHGQSVQSVIDPGTTLPIIITETLAFDTTQGRQRPECDISGGVPECAIAARPILEVSPQYAEEATVNRNHTGATWIKAYIDSTGHVLWATVIKSDDPRRNKAALRAMMQWRFIPCHFNGKPVRSCATFPFRYGYK